MRRSELHLLSLLSLVFLQLTCHGTVMANVHNETHAHQRNSPSQVNTSAQVDVTEGLTREAGHESDEQPNSTNEEAPLLLTWRHFDLNLARGEMSINSKVLDVREQSNTGLGTGLVVWDGSILLAKVLEHQYKQQIQNSNVLEVGAGTGVVGLAAALLGAKHVAITDLEYTLDNIRQNIELNSKHYAKGAVVEAFELDWFKSLKQYQNTLPSSIDYILASDVVWVEELIEPLVLVLKQLMEFTIDGSQRNPPVLLISHQTRTLRADNKLFGGLKSAGMQVAQLEPSEYHPEFQPSQALKVYKVVYNPEQACSEQSMTEN